jgi:type I restriction enzyme S subunit
LTNGRSISEVTFPLPGKEDQRAIAQALTDIDDLIASLDALIAKKRAIRQGAMQQLLTGKRRLLGFAGEWQTRNIRDIAELDPENLGASTPPNWEFNYISLEDISRGDQLGHVSVTFGNAPSRARRKIRSGDILFGTVRPNLQSHCLFAREDGPWIASTGFCVVRCRDNEADPGFIFHQLMGREVAAQIERIIAGSNYPAVSSRDVGALAIATPSLDEQQAISALIGEMTEEIAVLASKKKKTETIRQGMMQQLLTGRTRLA